MAKAHCHYCRPAPELDRGQPDEGDPYRLLGVCPRCGRWYLCESLPEPQHSRTVHLRDVPRLSDYGLEPLDVPAAYGLERIVAPAAAAEIGGTLVAAPSAAAGPPARF